MRSVKLSVATILAGGLVLLASPTVWAKSHRTVHFQQSGSETTVPLDLDADSGLDISALGIDSGKSDMGPYTDQTVGEADLDLTGTGCSGPPPFDTTGVSCTLPDSSSGCKFALVGGSDVFRFDSTGDLLFAINELGSACVNLATSAATFSGSGAIGGGTGKFSGATGTISFTGESANLNTDSAGHGFAWFRAGGTIELNLP